MLRFVVACLLAATAAAASPGPQPLPMPPLPPAAADTAYPGVIRLSIDARDTARRIVRVRETIPVAAGPLVLLYPEWVPGAHAPRNTVDRLSGLIVTAGGKRIEWRRDAVAPHAFRLDVPAGVASLDVRFEWLAPTDAKQGRVTITDDIAHLQPQSLILYPAGHFARRIMVEASVTIPAGWQLATALDSDGTSGATTAFKRTDLETFTDSPIYAGANVRKIVLDDGPRPVRLNLFAEDPAQLAIADAQIAQYRALLVQTDRLFGGARPFDHYDFLIGLSDTLGGIGREHRRSTEIVSRADFFTGWDRAAAGRATIPHEYEHAWNGKFRRGADSWTPDLNTPIRNSLLWVYEGQTQYWGNVLTARAGLITPEQARDALAQAAATYQTQPGRAWRALADTVHDPVIAARRPQPWAGWQRGEDYYVEGQLIWLDADTLIRDKTGGTKSLDDFARSFFGGGDGDVPIATYEFAEVVAALNRVVPHDWAGFLTARLAAHDRAPLDGLARGGYRLAWSATPSDYARTADAVAKRTDLGWSIGVAIDNKDATLSAVQWEGPAFKAGLTVGTQLIAVNGAPYTPELLIAAIRAAKDTAAPITLIVKAADRLGSVTIEWRGGLRYPRLERIPGTPALIDAIYAPR